ncbi:Glutathione S-transferase 1 [Pseudolycoriella hygida]|uniref:glutathione transferase n=1 Tax=Pseudolycoriella hygida TaxID=35572 RepID=A0A9Q0N177_9DIPT|nr:Glutathione S-transferase 1 [Pseudolycoriella hygida]
MKKPILYCSELSPAVRAVLLTAKAMDLELELRGATEFPQAGVDGINEAYGFMEQFLKSDSYLVGDSVTVADYCCVASVSTIQYAAPIDSYLFPNVFEWTINLLAGEHLTPEYLDMNPQHTIPTLDDNGDILWDSQAICTYLIDKYAPNDDLYTRELYTRARINQRLYFISSVFYPKMVMINGAILFRGATEFPQAGVDGINEAYGFMEQFLKSDSYLVGDSVTVADYCCVASVSTIQYAAPIDSYLFPNVFEWFERMKTIPFYDEVNGKNVEMFEQLVVVDFSKKEHLSETFCTINPHHTVPTLVDDGEVIWDSHAIMAYLVSKYGKSDSLYPKDLTARAKIDQCLHFDTAVIFSGAITSFVKTILYGGKSEFQAESLELTNKAYDYTEKLLKDEFLVGNNLTLADISCCIDLLTLDKLVPMDKNRHPKLVAWMENVSKIPNFHDINDEGVQQLHSRFESCMAANKKTAN